MTVYVRLARSLYELRDVTAVELAEHAGVGRAAAKAYLHQRNGKLVESVGSAATSGRGRRATRWRLTEQGESLLRGELQQLLIKDVSFFEEQVSAATKVRVQVEQILADLELFAREADYVHPQEWDARHAWLYQRVRAASTAIHDLGELELFRLEIAALSHVGDALDRLSSSRLEKVKDSGGVAGHDCVEGDVRTIALMGPAGAGKTSLAEALLFAAGAIGRQGSVADGSSTGDASPEARARGGSTELNLMHFDYLGDHYVLTDCPGSVGLAAEGTLAAAVADLAIVVVDPDPDRALLAEPTLRQLEAQGIPHMIFVNKIDQARGSIQRLLEALQPMSASPLIARWIPIRDGEKITGFVDIALERAYYYQPGKPSEQKDIPADLADREALERSAMLEKLADHDDALLEALLMDEVPDRETVFADLAKETGAGQIVPVLFGSALNASGVRRLLKTLRHEVPGPKTAAERLRAGAQDVAAFVFKVSSEGPIGRLAFTRVFGAGLKEGQELVSSAGDHVRAGGLFALQGTKTTRLGEARNGDVVAIAGLAGAAAGEWLASDKCPPLPEMVQPARNHSLAISALDPRDDVRLSVSLHKLIEEDPGLALEQDVAVREIRLRAVNDEHLKVTLERLRRRFAVGVACSQPCIGYKESIRRSVTQRGRHKKRSGGHGEFGDCVLEVKPLARGAGFRFDDRITGGVVPKQWIPAVEDGVRDALVRGPLGFPVVDVHVTLVDGSYHNIDSSELAFRTAGRIGMTEALAQAVPLLLEPVMKVTIFVPSDAAARAASAVASRRGQVLGMEPRGGWSRWDRVEALIPEAEMQDFDVELRSLSQGLATYEAAYDHLAELNGVLAEKVVQNEPEFA